jgi:hypothetical protein
MMMMMMMMIKTGHKSLKTHECREYSTLVIDARKIKRKSETHAQIDKSYKNICKGFSFLS